MRDISASKSISGHYYAVLNAIDYLIGLKEDEVLACEYKSSDIYVSKNGECISIESKYYSDSIGWGSDCFKNSIRNFLDIEIVNPMSKYVFLTNTAKKDKSSDLMRWIKLNNGNIKEESKKKEEQHLIIKLKELYENEIYNSIKKSEIKKGKTEEEIKLISKGIAQLNLSNINLNEFIKKVEFDFNRVTNYKTVNKNIRNYLEVNYPNLVADCDKIFACFEDYIWSNICDIGNEGIHNKKELKLEDVNYVIESFNERYEEIISDYEKKLVIDRFNLHGTVGENIKNFLINESATDDNKVVQYFNESIDNIINDMLEKIGDKNKWQKYISKMNNKTIDEITTSDLVEFIIYIAMINCIYIEDNSLESISFIEEDIFNLSFKNKKVGYYISNHIMTYKKALSNWVSQSYKKIDIHKKDNKFNDKYILLNCAKLRKCENNSIEVSSPIIEDIVYNIADIYESDKVYYDELKARLKINYHCGDCMKILDREFSEITTTYTGVFD